MKVTSSSAGSSASFLLSGRDDSTRSELDRLRREVMEKKGQIDILEREASKVDEIRDFLIGLIEDFQKLGQYQFFDSNEDLQKLLKNPVNGITLLRNGINNLITKHQNLSSNFELQMKRNLFPLEQELDQAKKINEDQNKGFTSDLEERTHKQNIIKYIEGEKTIFHRTILMKTAAYDRHQENDKGTIILVQNQMQQVQNQLSDAKKELENKEAEYRSLTSRAQDRQSFEEKQRQDYQELLARVEKLRKDYQAESHSHNQCQADLDAAKNELQQLTLMVGSYRDNRKTQQLLGEEAENRRIHSNFAIEKVEADRKQQKEEKKTIELEKQVSVLQQNIANLNEQIVITEQKLQMQMIKIPDFAQLHQALDRSLAMSKKFRDQVMETKYMLDEIREKNRILEQMEIHDSKVRTAQLKIPLPIDVTQPKKSDDDIKKAQEMSPKELDESVKIILQNYDNL
ncbi:hypothetical protein TVAG_056740 [Trichomonas vaginalis G3]|uniref:Uncharacterized protein n=1 Tax=Trichomonas vaginalis (strain ATCC PRA-98 / G3) TaxID=412133 RepID=A2ECN3_TRIV3|nr:hypothetical protein TVAGG3_0882240 [Trichomonas vaginalis G3]EAY09630.1 hypothetical protein TVAG_056740 [Trichomonas vaginalis G3]KAI5502141.1 hypothetical protein TVAGG3_0882240 [Trichomonas vaginalis G3]|eukprot:XP_001321853.1 hypothetical protein [Trichomonas vaginalis G3]